MRFISFSLLLFLYFINIEISCAQLEQTALTKIEQLKILFVEAESKNIDARKEKMTVRTAEAFLFYANWDEVNVATNKDIYELLPSGTFFYKNAAQLAQDLPNYERSQIILILDEALETINKLLNGEITRKPIPVINWANINIVGNQVMQNGKPVFLSDYNLKPETASDNINLTEYFGNKDGFVLGPNNVANSSGSLQTGIRNQLQSKPSGFFGDIFINNAGVPNWAETAYGPGFKMRENTFIRYDIDNPGAKTMFDYLLGSTIPLIKNKKYSKLGYLLANEPHFFTTTDNPFFTGPVSNFTIEKFRTWLTAKHGVIANLNNIWGTNYASFNTISLTIPLDVSTYPVGTAIYYDWNRFNMQRVTDWFTFLHNKIKEYDPNAKTHIKIIPEYWDENSRASGIDLEELTNLTDISGNDAKSHNSLMFGEPEPFWESRYSFYWKGISMPYDFMRSVSPDKIIYNSETHFLSTFEFRDLYLKPTYARAAYWLAILKGMNVSLSWFWSRRKDGSPSNNSRKGYGGSLNQQPAIVNAVEATFMDLNTFGEDIAAIQNLRKPLRIFYSKTSALNKTDHMDNLFELYENLHFESTPIGFVTKNIIQEQDNSNWDAILIYKTEFVTRDELNALQTYLDNGGTIIKDAISLTKNEYGNTHTIGLNSANGILRSGSTVQNIANQGVSIVSNNDGLPAITLNESNSLNQKSCYWRAYTNNEGEHIISIVNLGKDHTDVTLGLLDSNNAVKITNLFTGELLPTVFSMKPEEVHLLRVTDATLSSDEFVKSTLKHYPNPTTGIVTFSWNEVIKEVTIFNTLGQKIASVKGDKNNLNADLSDFPIGVYFVKIDSFKSSETISIIKK